ncbi:hypothetical protein SADUNF_Sadunf08G0149800 [Salix dunnii]|uniref:Uncharacterized protein n=1 Tax=Salix dunnii TaxID=1413687 RepID=A0A835MT27_9ROSI|nr:hypothetical protein SADUNF_Sadunf08G0149800 [Salix dunnii]
MKLVGTWTEFYIGLINNRNKRVLHGLPSPSSSRFFVKGTNTPFHLFPSGRNLLQTKTICFVVVASLEVIFPKERCPLRMIVYKAIIYLSLIQLEGEFTELEDYHKRSRNTDVLSGKREQGQRKLSERDFEREKECGTCMEKSAKMVLPICGLNLDSVLPFLPWQHKENELCRFRGSHQ